MEWALESPGQSHFKIRRKKELQKNLKKPSQWLLLSANLSQMLRKGINVLFFIVIFTSPAILEHCQFLLFFARHIQSVSPPFFFILSLLPLSIQITTEETHNATTKVITFEEWFNSTSKAQEELAGSETPVLTRSEVGLKLRPVGDYIKMLHRKPRPTPKPTPKASKNATASDNTTSSLEEDVEEEEEQDGESGEEETAQAKEQGEAKEEGDASSGEDAEGEL